MRNRLLSTFTDVLLSRSLLLPAIFFCLLVVHPVPACAAPAAKSNTRIVSEKMTYDSGKNRVIFEGKVHVIRPTMEIWSEVLTVILDDSGKKSTSSNANSLGVGGGKVDRIVAEKNVRIKQENKSGTCGKATYYVNAGKIVMEQSPIIVDGENRIRGRIINYFTDSGRSEVIGDVDVQFSTDDGKTPSLPGLDARQPAEPAGGKAQQ